MRVRVPIRRRSAFPSIDGVFIADTAEKCQQALRMIADWPVVGVDTEAYGADLREQSPVYHAQPVSIQFAGATGKQIFVPLWDRYRPLLDVFKGFLAEEQERKVLHNAKFDMHVLENAGAPMRGLLGDTLVMHYLYYNGEQFHGLKEAVKQIFNEETVEYSDTFRKPVLKKNGEPSARTYVPSLIEVIKEPSGIETLVRYSVKDPWYTVRLFTHLEEKLRATAWTKRGSYYDYYRQFELPYTTVLYNMERRGCLIDMPYLEKAKTDAEKKIEEIKFKFGHECAKRGVATTYIEKFSMDSPKQVAELLEGQLGIHIPDRTAKGAPSTSEGSLAKIRGPGKAIVDMLLEYRGLVKLQGTYLEAFSNLAPQYKGRLHTTLRQTGTATGRLSSSAPNLQNIPASEKDVFGIRKAFIAPEGMVIGDIDLSQIEVRLAAHFTKDATLLKAIREDWDIHALTATRTSDAVADFVVGKEINADLLHEVKKKFPDERRKAKPILFGTFYGMGPAKYADQVGVTVEEGKFALERFFSLYSGLRGGISTIQKSCYEQGHIRTLLRRYCQIPWIRSEQIELRKQAERQAFNYTIQGSAADLLRMSMLLIERDERLKQLGVRMTLQIHDELLFEVPKGAEQEVKPIIEEYVSHPYRCMGMQNLLVDTPAEIGFSNNWSEAKG